MHYSEEEKAMWLEDWQQSGKKAWAYARENGLVPQTFVGWTKKRPESRACFVELPTKAMAAVQTQEIVIEKGAVKIHLPMSIGSGELRLIFNALREAI